jgi:hypothetical protein
MSMNLTSNDSEHSSDGTSATWQQITSSFRSENAPLTNELQRIEPKITGSIGAKLKPYSEPTTVTLQPILNQNSGRMSYFNDIYQQVPSKICSLDEIFKLIESDEGLKASTLEVRNALSKGGGDKRSKDVLNAKSCLPAITVSGIVSSRAGAPNLQHSGLVQADIDGLKVEEAIKSKSVIAGDPSVALTFISPTGTGIKAIVRVRLPEQPSENIKVWHEWAVATVQSYFLEKYEITIDPAPKNPASLMYLCHDPEPAGCGNRAVPLDVVAKKNPKGLNGLGGSDFSAWARKQGYSGDLRTLDIKKLAEATGVLVREISDTKFAIKCPWIEEHTTASTGSDTVLLINKTSTGVQAVFKCQHGHCQHRRLRDFLERCPAEIVDRCCHKRYTNEAFRPGIELPRDDRLISEFAEDLGEKLKNRGLYMRGGSVMVVHNGESVLLNHEFFRTWCEKYIYTYTQKYQGKDVVEMSRTMSSELAKAAIVSPQFTGKLPELAGITPYRAPVLRKSGKIDLLPIGYDVESKFLTLDEGFEFETDWTLERGKNFIDDLLSEFAFADDGGRSKSVAISAMLSIFAPLLVDRLAPRPAFIYIANSEGSGKTLLAQIAGAPLGIVPVTTAPNSEEEWQKKILASVMSSAQMMLLDNAKGFLNSSALEALLSSPKYEGRVLGSSKIYKGEAQMVIVITGNALTVTPDLSRRSLIVELFSETLRAEDRVFKRVLDVSEIERQRPSILAALWSFIEEWDRQGRPEGTIRNASFSRWAATFGGIMEVAGYVNPCMRPEIDDMVDPDISDMMKLAGLIDADKEIVFESLGEICMREGLFEKATNEVDENSLNRRGRSTLARIFKRFVGKIVGENFRFVATGSGRNRTYKFERIQKNHS